jgi:hypothetical protein
MQRQTDELYKDLGFIKVEEDQISFHSRPHFKVSVESLILVNKHSELKEKVHKGQHLDGNFENI